MKYVAAIIHTPIAFVKMLENEYGCVFKITRRELFNKCGFRGIGIREKFGQMQDSQWHDVVLMERRSKGEG